MNRLVRTRAGLVRGVQHGGVVEFLGVPYAEPPSGARRFLPPEPRAPWVGVLDATARGPASPQTVVQGVLNPLGRLSPGTGMDSLRVNVWTPAPGGTRLPVLVWIHGGGWGTGTGNDSVYDGCRFAEAGVVVVTLNYRLGIEGYLYLGDHFADAPGSGNLGNLDQLLALQWVQDNIGAFGGDPGDVTVAGQSAGAMSIAMHMGAPRAAGLFHRAILQSGAAQGLSTSTAALVTAETLQRLQLPTNDLDGLRSISVPQLLLVHDAVKRECMAGRSIDRFGAAVKTGLAFQPVYDTDLYPEEPLEAVRRGMSRGVGLLIGWTEEEFLALLAPIRAAITDEWTAASIAPFAPPDGPSPAALIDTYRSHRPGASDLRIAAAIESDKVFRVPAVRLADAHLAAGGTAHVYEFAWRSTAYPAELGGSFHTLDNPFVFDTVDTEEGRAVVGDDAPEALTRAVHRSWIAFVTGGLPGPASQWPAYDPGDPVVMRFDRVSEAGALPRADELRLWEGFTV